MSRYKPNWDIDLQHGEFAEGLLADILRLTGEHIEVKLERGQWATTGNIYAEFECVGKESGWATTKAEWAAFVLSPGPFILVFPTQLLHQFIAYGNGGELRDGAADGDHPTRGYLVPIVELFNWAKKQAKRMAA